MRPHLLHQSIDKLLRTRPAGKSGQESLQRTVLKLAGSAAPCLGHSVGEPEQVFPLWQRQVRILKGRDYQGNPHEMSPGQDLRLPAGPWLTDLRFGDTGVRC